ncbi:MAG: hypothetical protein AB7U75_20950 [Hyphomicrobiaceae bacterium]
MGRQKLLAEIIVGAAVATELSEAATATAMSIYRIMRETAQQ